MTIEEFIEERFSMTLQKMGVTDTSGIDFVIFYEQNTTRRSQSSMEDMANWWSLPYAVNRRLNYVEVINRIMYFESIAPLWINISFVRSNLIGLEVSQKLRNRKGIIQYHDTNEIAPFRIKEPYLSFDKNEERNGLLAHITLTLVSTSVQIEYFENERPTLSEIRSCIQENFKNKYTFFPNDYSHRNRGEEGFTELILKKSHNEDSYQIINQKEDILKKSSDLDELIDEFIEKELHYRIGEIEIIK